MASDFQNVSWDALEYEHKEKASDWFWALGIIAVAATLTAIIYGNYIFAILIVIGSLTLALFSVRQPEIIHFEITKNGFAVNKKIYPYNNLKSFWIDETGEKPQLLLLSNRMVLPLLSIPLDGASDERIRLALLKFIKEEELKEPPTHRILEHFGF